MTTSGIGSGDGGAAMRTGANTVLFSPFSLAEAMSQIARCGYENVELAAIAGMCEHLVLDEWQSQASEVKDLAAANGLALVSMEVASLDLARLEPAFAAAEALGIGVVNVGPGGRSGEAGALEATIDRLNEGAKRAADHGVTLCVKAHLGAAMCDTPTTVRVLEEVRSDAVGIDVDPSHLYRAGENPAESLRTVLARVRHVHVRDCPPGVAGPGPIAAQACGRGGGIDLIGFCDVLVQSAYTGPVCLEVIGAKPEDAVSDLVAIAAETHGYLSAAFQALSRSGQEH